MKACSVDSTDSSTLPGAVCSLWMYSGAAQATCTVISNIKVRLLLKKMPVTSSGARAYDRISQKCARKKGISRALTRSMKNAHTSGTIINARCEAP